MQEILKIISPSLVTIIGWYVIFSQSNKFKAREEVKNLVDQACVEIDEIFTLTNQYYSQNSGHINYISSDIRAKFLVLSHYLILIHDFGVKINASNSLISYRKFVMGDHFETLSYKNQLFIQNRVADIANSRSELQFRIRQSYFNWAKEVKFWSIFK